MATLEATADPQAAPQPPSPGEATWKDGVERQLFGLYIGEKAWMLDKVQRQQSVVLDLARAAATGDYSNVGKAATEGDDTMSVSVGNSTYNYHYAATNQAAATDNSSGASPATSVASVADILPKAVPVDASQLDTLKAKIATLESNAKAAIDIVSQPAAANMSPWLKALAIGLPLLGTGIGGAGLASYFLKPAAQTIIQKAADKTKWALEIVPPDTTEASAN